jgi:hypothetical protein
MTGNADADHNVYDCDCGGSYQTGPALGKPAGAVCDVRDVAASRAVAKIVWLTNLRERSTFGPRVENVLNLAALLSARSPLRWSAGVVLSTLAVLCLPTSTAAKLCGDNVGGVDIPCACGDTVVGDLVLSDDPVTTTVCASDALVVRAAADTAQGLTIDLAGKTLRGNGHGTGIWLIDGGPGGARVISTGDRAQLLGFMDGVVANGANSVALVDNLRIVGSARDGLRVSALRYSIHAIEVSNSGHTGFVLGGRRFEVTSTSASNSKANGYAVSGADGVVGVPGAGNVTRGSGHAGFTVSGVRHQLVECGASASSHEGVHLNGMHFTITACTAENNGLDGIVGTGMDWRLVGNRALNNQRHGLMVRGAQLADGGGNSGSGNGSGPLAYPVTQCAIDGVPCAH